MRALASVALALAAACAPPPPPATERAFAGWLAGGEARAESFARFEAMLQSQAVSDVVPNYQLWRVDRLDPACSQSAFEAPPEELWPNLVPALLLLRDHVEPAIGEVEIESAYRGPELNACLRGATASKHRDFSALDLVPVESAVTRETMIEALCAMHARVGARLRIGLGLYDGRRFHLDARGFRGWGRDHRAGTFPCAQ